MARRLFLTIIAVAFVAALVAPVAASAGAARPVSVQPAVSGCTVFPAAWGKRIYDETVQLVRAEWDVNTPDNASSDLTSRIIYLHQRGCGDVLDLYLYGPVVKRLTADQHAWHLAVVEYLYPD